MPRSRSGTTQSGRGRFGDAGRVIGGTSGDLDVYWGLHLALFLVRNGQEKMGEWLISGTGKIFYHFMDLFSAVAVLPVHN